MFIVTVAASCKKNDNTVSSPGYASYSSMNAIYDLLRNQPAYFTVNAATGGSFYGNSGTRYIFPANCFVDGTGANVTGNVQVAATEYLKKGDMIFSKMLPISGNEPLLSGGEISVTATQGGNKVFMKPGFTFRANIPQGGTAQQGMMLFLGRPVQDTAKIDTNINNVNWAFAIDTGHNGVTYIPSVIDTISIISDSLRQCNADQFMTAPNYQTFKVTVVVTGATLSPTTEVKGFTLYDTFKGAWPLGCIGSYANGVFTEQHVPNIPVHFAVYTLIDNKFYGGVLAKTPVTGANYTVTLTQVDPVAFKGQLNNLVN